MEKGVHPLVVQTAEVEMSCERCSRASLPDRYGKGMSEIVLK
jgi:hypothetical protein